MAVKVTVTKPETPSEAAAKQANRLVYVTDSRGRKIGLRQPSFLEEFRIIEAVGPELAANTTYMTMVNPLLFIAEIDGIATEPPHNKRAVEALIQWAGREGFTAVLEGLTEHFTGDAKALETKIKNGDGTPA